MAKTLPNVRCLNGVVCKILFGFRDREGAVWVTRACHPNTYAGLNTNKQLTKDLVTCMRCIGET